MTSAENPDHGGFMREVGSRLLVYWPAKVIGVSLGMTAFFVVYFLLLHHPIFPVTTMPLTAVDRLINFHPVTLPLYLSLWFYVSLAFALLETRRELLSSAAVAIALSVVGLGIFLLWPTAAPNLGTNWAPHSAFAFLESIDASGNACPSLHVAFAVFAGARVEWALREMHARVFLRAGNWLWCLGIIYSTLATGQHVVIDVLAGAVLGTAIAVPRFFALPVTRPSGVAAKGV